MTLDDAIHAIVAVIEGTNRVISITPCGVYEVGTLSEETQ